MPDILLPCGVIDVVFSRVQDLGHAKGTLTHRLHELLRVACSGNVSVLVEEDGVVGARVLRQRKEELGYLGERVLVRVGGFERVEEVVGCDGVPGDSLVDDSGRDLPAGHRVLDGPHDSEYQDEGESKAGLEAPYTVP